MKLHFSLLATWAWQMLKTKFMKKEYYGGGEDFAVLFKCMWKNSLLFLSGQLHFYLGRHFYLKQYTLLTQYSQQLRVLPKGPMATSHCQPKDLNQWPSYLRHTTPRQVCDSQTEWENYKAQKARPSDRIESPDSARYKTMYSTEKVPCWLICCLQTVNRLLRKAL